MSKLFGRRRPRAWNEIVAVLDAAEVARARGWQPVSGRPFDGHLEDAVHRATISMYIPVGLDAWVRKNTRIGTTEFHDVYHTQVDGRGVTVGNGWTNIQPEALYSPDDWKGVAVCAVELPAVLPIVCIQPRRFPAAVDVRPTPTGDARFDEQFTLFTAPGFEPFLTAAVQARVMARDDWMFLSERALLGCVAKDASANVGEMQSLIDQVLDIVTTIPTNALPAHVDHSHDDLIARIMQLKSVDEALAFLHELSPDERQQLAAADTPLAAFADVETPQQAMQRLQTLDEVHKMQLFAMFARVKDARD